MSQFELLMPKLGESVEEATITKWFVKEGDSIEEDQVLVEIATDKVDSEIPSPVAGKVIKLLYNDNDKIAVGKVIAIINTGGDDAAVTSEKETPKVEETVSTKSAESSTSLNSSSGKFYSPLVKSISKQEGISVDELDAIAGTGLAGRVKKEDVINYLSTRGSASKDVVKNEPVAPIASPTVTSQPAKTNEPSKVSSSVSGGDEIVEMDRMRKIISEHMVKSIQTSVHVTNMVEADVTNLVLWRNLMKNEFEKREKTKLTFMPAFIEAAARALRDFPMVNASVDGTNIILRKAVNIGVAVSLPTGNLIVPVIKNADQRNQVGLAVELNRLAEQARINKLLPDDISGGTFTISNFGSFRNSMGTPIINQPQVAILATGSIEKKPAVLETPAGDVIAIRHKMFLSLTYDHRIIDGALGGGFLRRIADYLENWDINRKV